MHIHHHQSRSKQWSWRMRWICWSIKARNPLSNPLPKLKLVRYRTSLSPLSKRKSPEAVLQDDQNHLCIYMTLGNGNVWLPHRRPEIPQVQQAQTEDRSDLKAYDGKQVSTESNRPVFLSLSGQLVTTYLGS
jgi:hypothetical protein